MVPRRVPGRVVMTTRCFKNKNTSSYVFMCTLFGVSHPCLGGLCERKATELPAAVEFEAVPGGAGSLELGGERWARGSRHHILCLSVLFYT